MSRELKFRAWDKTENVMLTINPISSYLGCDSSDGKKNRHDKRSVMTWDGHCYVDGYLQDYILLQFTGLKDKNGVEIFEGDIVKCLIDFGPGGEEERIVAVSITPFGTYPLMDWLWKEGKLPEVIGNIYQNPELIKN